MAPCSISTLPHELLHEVCEYLCWHCRGETPVTDPTEPVTRPWTPDEQTALLSLSRTSRSLRAVAQPVLHHHLHTVRESDVFLFVRTLTERPDLRVSVIEVDIIHAVPGEVERRLLRTAWKRRYKPGDLDRARSASQQHDVLVAKLLQLTPRLQRAYIRVHEYYTALPDPAHTDAALPLLKTLTISSFQRNLALDRAAPIIRLAGNNLEALHPHDCLCITDSSNHDDDSSSPIDIDTLIPGWTTTALANLTSLSLIDTALTAEHLAALLSGVGPRLAKLTLNPRGLSLRPTSEEVQLNEALPLLLPWRATLRELAFYHLAGQPYVDRPDGSGGRLAQFSALETLRLWADLLAPGSAWEEGSSAAGAFPRSLRELRLCGWSFDVAVVECLLDAYLAGDLPGLQRVELDDLSGDKRVPEEDRRRLRRAAEGFRSAGVACVVHPWSVSGLEYWWED
jgi:hypothetical protein